MKKLIGHLLVTLFCAVSVYLLTCFKKGSFDVMGMEETTRANMIGAFVILNASGQLFYFGLKNDYL